MHELKVEYRSINDVTPYEGNARAHSEQQIKQIERSIMRWGFYNPIKVDQNGIIIAGHGRLKAAQNLGLKEVPVIAVHCETEADRRALTIVDNSIAENATWDEQLLKIEAEFLREVEDFDLEDLALDPVFLDELLLSDDSEDGEGEGEEENVPEPPDDPVSCVGDRVKKGHVLGVISDPFGRDKHEILARRTGIIIGATTMPLLNRGDAAFHIATFENATDVEESVGAFEEELDDANEDRFLD